MQKYKNDIYIEILQWAFKKWKFNINEIYKNFPEHKNIIDREKEHSNIFNCIEAWKEEYFLSFDDRFKLLEFEALEEARETSRKATTYATIAMWITWIVWIIQILIAIYK